MTDGPGSRPRRRRAACDVLDVCDPVDLCCSLGDLLPLQVVGLHLLAGVLRHPLEVVRLRPAREEGGTRPAGWGVVAVRCYRRWASPSTPRCPQSPCCSAYAEQALLTLGLRDGARAGWRRVRDCGRVPATARP